MRFEELHIPAKVFQGIRVLWTWNHDHDRWPVAAFIHKHLPQWFDYLVIDESHQTKSADTAIGQAMGSLVAACKRTICLTGTLLGGYAWHVRPLLFRIAPRCLIAEGLEWNKPAEFDNRYGRIEQKVVEVEKTGSDNRQSRGKTTSKTTRYVRPGIMPTLFGRHLIQNTIFLSLDELADNLPSLDEQVISVPMAGELLDSYKFVENTIDGIHRVAASGKKLRMSSAAAGHVEHRAAPAQQRRPALHPCRRRKHGAMSVYRHCGRRIMETVF